MKELPNTFFWIVGILVVFNAGTIISVLYGVGKALWFFAKLDSRVQKNTDDIHSAHKKIRELEGH